jgi:hypothetical protein
MDAFPFLFVALALFGALAAIAGYESRDGFEQSGR